MISACRGADDHQAVIACLRMAVAGRKADRSRLDPDGPFAPKPAVRAVAMDRRSATEAVIKRRDDRSDDKYCTGLLRYVGPPKYRDGRKRSHARANLDRVFGL